MVRCLSFMQLIQYGPQFDPRHIIMLLCAILSYHVLFDEFRITCTHEMFTSVLFNLHTLILCVLGTQKGMSYKVYKVYNLYLAFQLVLGEPF